MGILLRTASRGLVYLYLDGVISFRINVFGVRYLLWYPWFSFICYIYLDFVWSQIHQVEWPKGVFTFYSDYAKLAASTFRPHLCRFHLKLSLYYFLYFYFELRFTSGPILNPAVLNCEANKDFIGKSAYLSRYIHPSSIILRIIQRIIIK